MGSHMVEFELLTQTPTMNAIEIPMNFQRAQKKKT